MTKLDKIKIVVQSEEFKINKDEFEKYLEKIKKTGDEEVNKKLAEIKAKDKL